MKRAFWFFVVVVFVFVVYGCKKKAMVIIESRLSPKVRHMFSGSRFMPALLRRRVNLRGWGWK